MTLELLSMIGFGGLVESGFSEEQAMWLIK
jgi:hypothetical protein